MKRYEAIEAKVYITSTGRRISKFSSYIGDGVLTKIGYTVRDNRNNTEGVGRVPWKTIDEAQAFCDKWNKPDDSVCTPCYGGKTW